MASPFPDCLPELVIHDTQLGLLTNTVANARLTHVDRVGEDVPIAVVDLQKVYLLMDLTQGQATGVELKGQDDFFGLFGIGLPTLHDARRTVPMLADLDTHPAIAGWRLAARHAAL
jgi:hypothetical protein